MCDCAYAIQSVSKDQRNDNPIQGRGGKPGVSITKRLLPTDKCSSETWQDYKAKLKERIKNSKQRTQLIKPEVNGYTRISDADYLKD